MCESTAVSPAHRDQDVHFPRLREQFGQVASARCGEVARWRGVRLRGAHLYAHALHARRAAAEQQQQRDDAHGTAHKLARRHVWPPHPRADAAAARGGEHARSSRCGRAGGGRVGCASAVRAPPARLARVPRLPLPRKGVRSSNAHPPRLRCRSASPAASVRYSRPLATARWPPRLRVAPRCCLQGTRPHRFRPAPPPHPCARRCRWSL